MRRDLFQVRGNGVNIGERVRHRTRNDCGIGELVEIYPDGLCKAVFPSGTFSGIPLDALVSVEEEIRIENQRRSKEAVLTLLNADNYDGAEECYKEQCAEWWNRNEYETEIRRARENQARRAAEREARKVAESREKLRRQVNAFLDSAHYGEADRLYQAHCADWWEQPDYEADKVRAQFVHCFIATYRSGSLAELDSLYRDRPENVNLSTEDFVALKLPKVHKRLAAVGMRLDEEQEYANARPESRLLIKARAGSGKTRTLCARAALAIRDEKLDPNRVLILAFNKAAAAEAKHRVQKVGGIADYENARTFHSLAYQLVKPKKKLLFDAGGNPSGREQSRFAQRMMQRILNPAFKEAMVEFFRKELEQVENIGRDLPPKEYLVFRRALEHVTLKGERVKSNGEKFIADFLFEHGIEYRYERAWDWKDKLSDGTIYRPDFSIVVNSADYILEHWAIDPEDRHAELPVHWMTSTEVYRRQISAKRQFCQERGIPLLETHTGMMQSGREAFENRLAYLLEKNNIRCQKLPKEEIVHRVFESDFAISRMAELFLQFIQRAKKRAWSPEYVAQHVTDAPDKEPRARLFHQLALRAYREYEAMLAEQQAMDFDDLVMQAIEEVRSRGASASIHLGQGRMMPIGDLQWILLDEYQDFSELYFRMLEAVLQVNSRVRLVAVGDDWQAINSFAGAELRFFEQFASYFLGGESVGVTTNYRSDSLVVAAGNRLMEGRGQAAKVSRSASGLTEVRYLGDIWIEFRQGDHVSEQRQADALFLPPRPDGRNPSALALRQAQALKACAQIILDAPDQKTVLLARTGVAYGLELDEFRSRLIQALSVLLGVVGKDFEGGIDAMTAHGSKGQEAHTVIILDATQRQFPKIHPDNLLFELFGVTPHSVLEEERRLFYVAMTRAEHRLFVLTDKGEEAPYLEVINPRPGTSSSPSHRGDRERQSLGQLAMKIRSKIDALGEPVESLAQALNRDPWAHVRKNVSPALSDLIAALETAGIPVPETEYYLSGEDEFFAELAWPNSSPPVAILTGEQLEFANRWTSHGWKVPGPDLQLAQVVAGVKHYVLGQKH